MLSSVLCGVSYELEGTHHRDRIIKLNGDFLDLPRGSIYKHKLQACPNSKLPNQAIRWNFHQFTVH